MRELEERKNFSFYLFFFLLSLFILVMEGSILGILFSTAIIPDLLLVVVTCLAFIQGEKRGVVLGLSAGLLQDLFFGPALGVFALSKMAVAYLVGLTAREIYKDQLAGPMFIAFLATFVHEFIVFFLGMLFWGRTGNFFYLLDMFFLPKAVYHFLLTVPVYTILYRLENQGLFAGPGGRLLDG